ncbi:MAG: NADH-quinone oxidoreductase subunit N [Acidobacteria bacterium]|nr:NADH-quinone oxidoreductase subunit N [Acidobacteriota bacterium]
MDLEYTTLLPEIILSLSGILLMMSAPMVDRERQHSLGYPALLGIGTAFAATVVQWGLSGEGFYGMVFQDSFSQLCKLLFLFSAAAITLSAMSYLEREKLLHGEFFALLSFATVGMCLMASSADLILTFLGLEILSVSTYILVAFREKDPKSTESALKYFILGAFSTAFLLYGIAFIYGATGTTRYTQVADFLSSASFYPLALALGLALIAVGFGFKAAVTPFHVWTPDVYEGAPLPIAMHLAVSSKAAALVALLRIFYQMLPDLSQQWEGMLSISAVLTMAVGNIAALTQTNIKRMLAYSSIAHAGYLLVGFCANNASGVQAMLFYLFAYALMNVGAFTVIQVMARDNERFLSISDFRGTARRHPYLSAALASFLVSLAGIPATAGFMGKLFMFAAAIESQHYTLVVIALLASAVGLYYYLRVIVLMYMWEPSDILEPAPVPLSAKIVIAIMIIGTFYLGIYPKPILDLASEAAIF